MISVATQKAAMSTPKPMDADQVWTWSDEWGAYIMEVRKEGAGGSDASTTDVDAIKGGGKGKGKTLVQLWIARAFRKGV